MICANLTVVHTLAGGLCRVGFAPFRCQKRTRLQTTDGHTSGSAPRPPDGWNNDFQGTNSCHVVDPSHCRKSLVLQGMAEPRRQSVCNQPHPCGEVEMHDLNSTCNLINQPRRALLCVGNGPVQCASRVLASHAKTYSSHLPRKTTT